MAFTADYRAAVVLEQSEWDLNDDPWRSWDLDHMFYDEDYGTSCVWVYGPDSMALRLSTGYLV